MNLVARPLRADSAAALGTAAMNEATGPISIAADSALRMREGTSDVWILSGNCFVHQGLAYLRGATAVVWIDRSEQASGARVDVYLEGDVSIDGRTLDGASTNNGKSSWFGRLASASAPSVRVGNVSEANNGAPPIYDRAVARRHPPQQGEVRRTQFTTSGPLDAAVAGPPPGMRSINFYPRSSQLPQGSITTSPDGQSWTAVVNSGVNLVVEGMGDAGAIDVSTDRLVVWATGIAAGGLGERMFQRDDLPLEVYMEGNIVFRQGDRVIHADRMYYDVQRQTGVAYNAQVFTPTGTHAGVVRLKGAVVEVVDGNNFVAHGAALTTSRLGLPSYWFESDRIMLHDIQLPTAGPVYSTAPVDPFSERSADRRQLATAEGNSVYLEGLPIFYWPTMKTDLQRPTYYLADLKLKSDSVFGNQIYTTWDSYQVLGLEPLPGTEWDFDLDYLDDRGPAGGTHFGYEGNGLLGIAGEYRGGFDGWVIDDDGLDNLGRDRRALTPEEEFRGRAVWRHRHEMPYNFALSAEFGWLSDRNFLEQYFEKDWDEEKDLTSGLELRQVVENSSWSIRANGQINDFFTQTEWLPRLDHFWIGQPLLSDRITWFEHTSVGYAEMRAAEAPLDPVDAAKFDPLAWEGDFGGERAVTHHEIDAPFALGWMKVVPYAQGQLAHWGSDLTGDDLQRAYGQLGVRASVPMWCVDPTVESELWNLHGLAHKVVFEVDASYADASRDMTQLPLYDQLDDDAIEQFRRRFFFDTFGGMAGGNVPARFDERFYALRSGLGNSVTTPSAETLDDLASVRLGVRQRWQTKRGAPGTRQTIDWIKFDASAVVFPDADRDNFGQEIGLAEYDFSWRVGDRVTLVSDGLMDTFSDGQRFFSVGGFLNRPPNGNLFVGFRSLEGPISANVLSASVSYTTSPKWISTFGTSVDLGPDGNIGQYFTLTRIGESMLLRMGLNVDASRGSVGASFAIEPRFWPKARSRQGDGAFVLPQGTYNPE